MESQYYQSGLNNNYISNSMHNLIIIHTHNGNDNDTGNESVIELEHAHCIQ